MSDDARGCSYDRSKNQVVDELLRAVQGQSGVLEPVSCALPQLQPVDDLLQLIL